MFLWIKSVYDNFKYQRRIKKRMKELKKRDPFIYD